MLKKAIDRSLAGEVLQHVHTSDLKIKVVLFTEADIFMLTKEFPASAFAIMIE